MSDVWISLRGSGAPAPSGVAYLGLRYSLLGNQLARTRDQAWGGRIIHTEQAQAYRREVFLMLDNFAIRERRQFWDEKPRVHLQPVFVATSQSQDCGLNCPVLKRHHERRSPLVKFHRRRRKGGRRTKVVAVRWPETNSTKVDLAFPTSN